MWTTLTTFCRVFDAHPTLQAGFGNRVQFCDASEAPVKVLVVDHCPVPGCKVDHDCLLPLPIDDFSANIVVTRWFTPPCPKIDLRSTVSAFCALTRSFTTFTTCLITTNQIHNMNTTTLSLVPFRRAQRIAQSLQRADVELSGPRVAVLRL